MAQSPNHPITGAMIRPDQNMLSRRAALPGQSQPLRYLRAAGAVLALGAALRLLDLGSAPYSHDEAIHANFSLALGDYRYDPIYHGPLLYHLTALVFWAVGAHDFSARLVPALLGIVLLALVLGPARRWLGTGGALWSAMLLAVSPVTVAYSRRLLHDAPVLALSLGAVLCFQTARETGSGTRVGRRARIGVGALLSLLLATKANAFFIVAMLAALWLADALRRFSRVGRSVAPWLWWVPAAALSAVALASVVALREPPAVRAGNERMLTVVCLLALAAVWEWLRRAPMDAAPKGEATPAEVLDAAQINVAEETSAEAFQIAAPSPSRDWKTPLLGLAVAALLFAFFYARGVLWWRDPLHVAALYGGEIVGPESAIPRMLRYWGGQQGQPRLPGRHDYYIVHADPAQSPGHGRGEREGDRQPAAHTVHRFAAVVGADLVCDLRAGQRESALAAGSHYAAAVPAGRLLAGISAGAVVGAADARTRRDTGRTLRCVEASLPACGLGAVFLLRGISATSFERAGDRHEPLFYAQTTETFRDALFDGLRETSGSADSIWIFSGKDLPGEIARQGMAERVVSA